MRLVREIVSQGRAARMGAKLKVRQPLAKVEVILVDRQHQPWLEQHRSLIAEELNVKLVEFAPRADQYITYTVQPDLKRLGPKLGKRLPALKAALTKVDAAALLNKLEQEKQVAIELPDGPVTLDGDDLQVRLQAKPGWAAAQGPSCVVVLSTELDQQLLDEGIARELVHAIQTSRRDTNCNYTDRIAIGIVTADKDVENAARQFADYIQAETLGVRIQFEPIAAAEPQAMKIGSAEVQLYVKVIPQ
jgi:isoleucyl-tRNA synthetase